jgi:hypothetical protein
MAPADNNKPLEMVAGSGIDAVTSGGKPVPAFFNPLIDRKLSQRAAADSIDNWGGSAPKHALYGSVDATDSVAVEVNNSVAVRANPTSEPAISTDQTLDGATNASSMQAISSRSSATAWGL